MKNIQLLAPCILALLFSGIVSAQPCDPPAAHTTIHANTIKAGVLNGGDLFRSANEAQFIPNPTPMGPDPATIFAAGLWVGGIDPASNLKIAAVTDRADGKTDYWAGPLDASGTTDVLTCSNWDRHFRAKGADIKAFLDDLPDWANDLAAAIAAYPDIMGWPGLGNPHFDEVWGFDLPSNVSQGLAPFFDNNNDALYNPLDGDYPAVELQGKPKFVPAEMVWCVFNDEGGGNMHPVSGAGALQIEVQLMVWAFHCFDQPLLDNTLFTAHKIIYRGPEPLDSCFVGLWVDFEIGCQWDDYFGSAPALNAFYGYNSDALDLVNCPNRFGGIPPVQTVTFLNRSLDKFIYFNDPGIGTYPPAMTSPDLPEEFYRYLTGHWADGTPLTSGGSGYNTTGGTPADHAFPDPPDMSGWTMCEVNIPFGSHLLNLGSSKIPQLMPGQIEELVTAWTYHISDELPCGLGGTFDDIISIQDKFDNNFAGVCSGLTSVDDVVEASVRVFPNPAGASVTISYGDLTVREIRIVSADGKTVRTLQNIPPQQTAIDVVGLNDGIYYLIIQTEHGSATELVLLLP
ncbi:MAG: hypothetical protein EPGJADBJ_03234 [Saprospiraceae bacterium]|nr:hypothetical protein [Saprospiraceae bacterium]